jgi:spoIIIJ-associated protein
MISEKIKSIILEFTRKLGASEVEITEVGDGNGNLEFKIKNMEEKTIPFSKRDEFLKAMNHLIRKIAVKKLGEETPKFFVDVNGYRETRLGELKNKVMILRARSLALKTNVELPPMSAYERRLVHTLCEGSPNIKTESVGEGHRRRVVIKYVEDGEQPTL